MVFPSPSLRDRLIVAGQLRPADPHERTTAHQRYSVYLQAMGRSGVSTRSALDNQLMLAVLERWYTL